MQDLGYMREERAEKKRKQGGKKHGIISLAYISWEGDLELIDENLYTLILLYFYVNSGMFSYAIDDTYITRKQRPYPFTPFSPCLRLLLLSFPLFYVLQI